MVDSRADLKHVPDDEVMADETSHINPKITSVMARLKTMTARMEKAVEKRRGARSRAALVGPAPD